VHLQPRRPNAATVFPARKQTTVTARAIKIVLPLDPAAVMAAIKPLQKVEARLPFSIDADGRTLCCDFAPKAVRKAFSIIREHGEQNVSVIIQGKLGKDDVVLEAGLVAAPKLRQEAA
jgi:hypothetical protein